MEQHNMLSFCLIIGCSNNKKRRPGLSFCQVAKVITNQGETERIFFHCSASKMVVGNSYWGFDRKCCRIDRVCSIYFHSSEATYL